MSGFVVGLGGQFIPPMSEEGISKVRAFEEAALKTSQLAAKTLHLLHAMVYHRTMFMTAGTYLTGALIRIPTAVTISGDISVFLGDEWVRHTGYHVLPASAHRKQIFIAHSDTYVTMAFATLAKTVEEAEEEFTEEAALLLSRYNENEVIITGE